MVSVSACISISKQTLNPNFPHKIIEAFKNNKKKKHVKYFEYS